MYASVAIARTPGVPPTRMRGKLARQRTGPTGPFAYMAWTATALRNGSTDTVFTETDMDERERNAGNKA